MENKAPLDIIAANLPTYADLYSTPPRNCPTQGRLVKEAARIMSELERAGYQVVRRTDDAPIGDFARYAIESRAREIEAAIGRFRDCGVELARFSIVEWQGATHLCIDGQSRFSWRIRWPHMKGDG